MRRRPGFVTALVLISIGVVLLLNNLGVVHIDPRAFLPLWPVLLVLFAIEMLVSRTQSNVAYGIGVAWAILVILAMVGLAWNATRAAPVTIQAVTATPREALNVPVDRAATASLRAQLGSGSLLVTKALSTTGLISGTLYGAGSGLEVARRVEGGRANVSLTSEQGEGNAVERLAQIRSDAAWTLQLTDAVPWSLAVGLSSGRAELDLSGLDVRTIDLAIGIAEAVVKLPKSAGAETLIMGTAGSVTVQVPVGVQARIEVPRRLTSVDVGPGFEALGSGYQTAGFVASAPYQQVTIELGAGRIRLR